MPMPAIANTANFHTFASKASPRLKTRPRPLRRKLKFGHYMRDGERDREPMERME
jgi:hypothetical protein